MTSNGIRFQENLPLPLAPAALSDMTRFFRKHARFRVSYFFPRISGIFGIKSMLWEFYPRPWKSRRRENSGKAAVERKIPFDGCNTHRSTILNRNAFDWRTTNLAPFQESSPIIGRKSMQYDQLQLCLSIVLPWAKPEVVVTSLPGVTSMLCGTNYA
jgi:hypothetical protein